MTFEKTAPRHWYVTIHQFGGLTCGPFRTRKHAKEYAERLIA
jgi:phage gpG-like protein